MFRPTFCLARAGDDLVAAQQAVLDLRSYRRQIERDNVANLSYCAQLEQRAFRQSHREVVYDGSPLRPLGNRPVGSDLKPVSLRGDFGVVGLMKRGEEFRVTITARRVGRNTEPVRWALYSPDRLLLEKGSIALGTTQTVVRPATAEGVYNLTLSTSPNAAQVVLHGSAMAILGNRLNLLGASGRLVFFVPPGTKKFRVTLSSPAPGETASLAILDPDGREAVRGETGTAEEVPLDVAVPTGAAGKAWTVVPSKGSQGVLEDYTITLGPGLPPSWSLSPDQLLVPAKP